MDREIQQLVDMGATRAQARAALNKYKDVMQAAERIFDGAFDDVVDDDDADVDMASSGGGAGSSSRARSAPTDGSDAEEEDDEDGGDEEDDDEDAYIDYDSDDGIEEKKGNSNSHADPYAGIFFSKDRREEVIEVEEESEEEHVPDANQKALLMTQGQWMKGCPEGSEQSFLFSLYRELTEGQCPCPHGCGGALKRHKRDFFALFAEFSTYTTHLKKVAPRRCQKCLKRFCFACGEPMSEAEQEDSECLFHCSNLQGVILGVGLAMLEQSFMDEASGTSSPANAKATTGRRRKASDSLVPHAVTHPLETLFPVAGKKAKLGVGYAGDVREDNSGQAEAQAIQKAKDEKLSTLLRDIRVYLPNLNRECGGKSSDYLPHPTTLAHLRRRFNFVSSQLLRNDSLVDMSDRSVLYFELLNWLETISCHEALASMMGMPIMVPASVKTVTSRKGSPRNSPQIRERTIIYEGSSGPRELLEAIVIQAQAAIKGLDPSIKDPSDPTSLSEMTEEEKRMTQDDKGKGKDVGKLVSEENIKLFGFCRRILATAKAIDRSLRETKGDAFMDRLHASLPKIPGTSATESTVQYDASHTDEEVQKAYVEWANRARFEYCDLSIPPPEDAPPEETPQYKSYYSAEARMLANADIPKRSLAIAKELAVLTTNLPVAWNSSIFLRVDETRVDVIKALITGPEGTPYYNGCYLFDIFLGPSYNQSPPSVKYMTTNGGKYRFNPNLYADGKVCLSLLGTWSGPGWVSGRSTLLQVLISIQSMILCDEPYINEPGWATGAGTAQSKAYSANVRRMVVRTAMLGNLKNPPEPFGDVIRTHFRLKGRSIIKQLDEWLQLDDGKPLQQDGAYSSAKAAAPVSTSSNGFAEDVAELKALLENLMKGN